MSCCNRPSNAIGLAALLAATLAGCEADRSCELHTRWETVGAGSAERREIAALIRKRIMGAFIEAGSYEACEPAGMGRLPAVPFADCPRCDKLIERKLMVDVRRFLIAPEPFGDDQPVDLTESSN
jgi:hypothetical protein